jgi:hypothetical protein
MPDHGWLHSALLSRAPPALHRFAQQRQATPRQTMQYRVEQRMALPALHSTASPSMAAQRHGLQYRATTSRTLQCQHCPDPPGNA